MCLFVLKGPPWGGDAADHRAEPENPAEDQPVVMGRGSSNQHPKRSYRYIDSHVWFCFSVFCPLPLQQQLMSSPPPACCLFALKLFTSLCPSVITADSHPALPPPSLSHPSNLPAALWSSSFPPLSLSAIVTLPYWSRFCRVSFALSTRPCRTGAHAECLQSLPQIRNDLSMWIWRFRVSPSQTASSSSTREAFRSFVLAQTCNRPWVAAQPLVHLVPT